MEGRHVTGRTFDRPDIRSLGEVMLGWVRLSKGRLHDLPNTSNSILITYTLIAAIFLSKLVH